jgi:hypothetical protein
MPSAPPGAGWKRNLGGAKAPPHIWRQSRKRRFTLEAVERWGKANMTVEDEIGYRGELASAHGRNPTLRRYLEVVQDVIVLGLCAALFIAMLIKLFHLGIYSDR